MNFDLRRETRVEEIMDTRKLSAPVLRDTLKFLSFTNRYFGGNALVVKYLEKWSFGFPKDRPTTILDVGTGGGDLAVAAALWARRKEMNVHITAVDVTPQIADLARENAAEFPEIEIFNEDFRYLADRGEKFDYVTAGLLLHHVPPSETGNALKNFDRLARRGIIIGDLLRTWPGYGAVSVLSWAAGNSVVRHDGPLSVRRAFLPEELESAARNAGLSYLKAVREPWFRVSLTGEKNIPPSVYPRRKKR